MRKGFHTHVLTKPHDNLTKQISPVLQSKGMKAREGRGPLSTALQQKLEKKSSYLVGLSKKNESESGSSWSSLNSHFQWQCALRKLLFKWEEIVTTAKIGPVPRRVCWAKEKTQHNLLL